MTAIITCTVFLVGCTNGAPAQGGNPSILQTFRQTRETERTTKIQILEALIANEETNEETRQSAKEQKATTLQNILFETKAENILLSTLNIKDTVIARKGKHINVIVKSETPLTYLKVQLIHQILDKVNNEELDRDYIFIHYLGINSLSFK